MLLALLAGAFSATVCLARAPSGRRRQRRRAAEGRPLTTAPADLLASDLINHLGCIRGYCELVRMRSPRNGSAIRRMDAAMATCDEAAVLTRHLLAAHRDGR